MDYLYGMGLVFLFLASVFDFKSREIPDILSYSFIAITLVFRILFSLDLGINFLLEGLYGFLIFGAFGLILFFFGLWGGGDAKLMFGIGLVLGFELTLFNPIIIFLVAVLFTSAVYGVLYMFIMAIINFRKFYAEFKKYKRFLRLLFVLIPLAIISIIFLFQSNNPIIIMFLALLTVSPFLFLLILISKAVDKSCFRKLVPIEKLTEGDWLIEDIKKEDKILLKKRKIGITNSDLRKLKEIKEKYDIHKVMIKNGMPFVPPLFLAYIAYFFLTLYFKI